MKPHRARPPHRRPARVGTVHARCRECGGLATTEKVGVPAVLRHNPGCSASTPAAESEQDRACRDADRGVRCTYRHRGGRTEEVTMSTHTVQIEAISAGGLSGHEIVCTCGTRLTTSLSISQAERDGDAHLAWHARSGR